MQSYTYMRLRRWSLALTSAGGLPMSFVRGNKVFLQWWEHWLTRIHSAPLPGGSLPPTPDDAGTSDGKPLDDNKTRRVLRVGRWPSVEHVARPALPEIVVRQSPTKHYRNRRIAVGRSSA